MSEITVRSYDFANGVLVAGATGQSEVTKPKEEPKAKSACEVCKPKFRNGEIEWQELCANCRKLFVK